MTDADQLLVRAIVTHLPDVTPADARAALANAQVRRRATALDTFETDGEDWTPADRALYRFRIADLAASLFTELERPEPDVKRALLAASSFRRGLEQLLAADLAALAPPLGGV